MTEPAGEPVPVEELVIGEATRQQRGVDAAPPSGRPLAINLRVTDEAGRASRHTVYGDTPQDARDKAAEIRKRLEGGLPARDRRDTVAAFTQHWIETTLPASERKQNTKVMYAGVARTHILSGSLADVTLDRLRPSHVEGWVVGGVPLKVVSEILGHSSIAITGDIYGHVARRLPRGHDDARRRARRLNTAPVRTRSRPSAVTLRNPWPSWTPGASSGHEARLSQLRVG